MRAAWVAWAGLWVTLALLGQPLPAPPPQAPGEVISVRPSDPSARGWKIEVPDGGRFIGTNVPLVNYVMFAYHVREERIEGLPGWAKQQDYTINIVPAEAGGPNSWGVGTSETERFAKIGPVIEDVLAERFGLKAHWATKAESVYLLEVAKGGVKFKPAPAAEVEARKKAMAPGLYNGHGIIISKDATLGSLVGPLARDTGRDVIDQTGLAGNYNFTLRWAPLGTKPQADGTAALPATVFSALKEQLGLELKPGRGRGRYLVVDHIESLKP